MKSTQSRFFCVQCGHEGIPIVRKQNAQREPGHLKKLFCLYCKQEVNHAEIREIGGYTEEDFKTEFELGRFKDGIRVPLKELEDCEEECKCNINGKCWNANCSNYCLKREVIKGEG